MSGIRQTSANPYSVTNKSLKDGSVVCESLCKQICRIAQIETEMNDWSHIDKKRSENACTDQDRI